MSRRVVSADETSFPYRTDKLRVIGHGINCDFYAPPPAKPIAHQARRRTASLQQHPLIVQVARLAAVKHQATTIQAVAGTAGAAGADRRGAGWLVHGSMSGNCTR